MAKRNRKLNEGFSTAALTGKWLLIAAIAVSVSLLYVWQHVQLVRTGYAIKALEKEREKWQKANETLRLANEKLKNPQRIERVLAQSRLGLIFPPGKNVVRLRNAPRRERYAREKSESEGGTDTLLSYMRGAGGAGLNKM